MIDSRRLGILVALVLGCGPAAAAPKQDLGQLRAKIVSLQKELEHNEESKNEAADALRESERAISESERKLRDTTGAQREANASLEQLQLQKRLIEDRTRRQQQLLGKLLYQRYVEGEQEYLKLLLDSQDPNQVARNLQYYGYISRDRADAVKRLRRDQIELAAVIADTREKSNALATLAASELEQKRALEQEKARRAGILTRVAAQISQQRREISKLKRDESRLSRLVERIGRIIRHSPEPLANNRLPDASLDRNPFAGLKGRMSLPVRGVVTNRFGSQRMDGGVLWKGLFIRAATGSEVKAIAAGTVVFADWLRGFGNMIILDHGNGYMSLYGNNETIYKQVGEKVHGGDSIAAVGNSGGNAESGLYFELREQGTPLDPLKWVSVK